MTMEERKERGLLWTDTPETMEAQKIACGLAFEFSHLHPSETEKKMVLIREMFGSVGENVWIEPPMTLAFGKTVTIGEGTYINSNLTLVDDYKINIGNHVLIAPNVTICATAHPLHYKMRMHGEMYSKEVVIRDYVWIGSNAVILPGVTIGEHSVIGAGSIVTKDIPANTLAMGVPCRVVREIDERDLVWER
ncbi:MAG: galactoside O-acetyltransferase [Clostridiales bacterium]|nr:galactoside O-acetyltransferase [Clostridiales bacterium]